MKPLLSTDELIAHMKEKGITFNIVSEKEAKDFLSGHNYYLKLASYRFNYTKYGKGHPKEGKYQELDFGCLKELSTIDMYLRYHVIEMCLDIEHAIKVNLIDAVTNNPAENGYDIVKSYLSEEDPNFNILKSIRRHKSGEYCKDLISKYYPFFPVWVLVELISFGDLLHLTKFYDTKYGTQILMDHKFMNTIRDLRNAAAHSNCLMNTLTDTLQETKQPDSRITLFVKNLGGVSKYRREKYMHRSFSYDMVTLLYVYDHYMPNNAKQHRYEELSNFMHGRVIKHREYFTNNGKISGIYDFLKDIIDKLAN